MVGSKLYLIMKWFLKNSPSLQTGISNVFFFFRFFFLRFCISFNLSILDWQEFTLVGSSQTEKTHSKKDVQHISSSSVVKSWDHHIFFFTFWNLFNFITKLELHNLQKRWNKNKRRITKYFCLPVDYYSSCMFTVLHE